MTDYWAFEKGRTFYREGKKELTAKDQQRLLNKILVDKYREDIVIEFAKEQCFKQYGGKKRTSQDEKKIVSCIDGIHDEILPPNPEE